MKKTAAFLLSLVLLFAAASAAFAQEGNGSMTFPTAENTEFGAVNIDVAHEEFEKLGAELGDSLDVYFSNGFTLEDIPYYDGFYDRVGCPAVVDYPGTEIQIAFCFGDAMWDVSGCTAGETVTLNVREKGKYLDRQNAMATVYTDDRDDFESDEIFANFRAMAGGKLSTDTFFRGASPFDNVHHRAATADSLLKKAGVRFILNLANSEETIVSCLEEENFSSEYSALLYAGENVCALGLNMNYRSEEFMTSLAAGLREMMQHEGPYFIHCTEGKDRTGFVCLLLEALADASYEEIEADFMKTYDAYYGITKESDSAKYEALKTLRLHDMLWWLAELPDNTDLSGRHFKEDAENYLRTAGMTDGEIIKLENFLTE